MKSLRKLIAHKLYIREPVGRERIEENNFRADFLGDALGGAHGKLFLHENRAGVLFAGFRDQLGKSARSRLLSACFNGFLPDAELVEKVAKGRMKNKNLGAG